MRMMPTIAIVLPLLAGCELRVSHAPVDPGPGSSPPPPPAAERRFDREPVLGVLLATGPSAVITFAGVAQAGGARFPAGAVTAMVRQGRIQVAGRDLGPGPVDFRVEPGAGGERFRGNFAGEPWRCAGDLRLAAVGAQVQVIELVGMETYLAGVLTCEMSASYPPAALQAQAVAARSYAAARWFERADRAWQLDGDHIVDMEYRALQAPNRSVGEAAVRATRGVILRHGGQPVMAFFHAASGGRTAGAAAVREDAPGRAAVVGVEDAASVRGARSLGLFATHGEWRATLTFAQLTAAAQRWSEGGSGRARFGTVQKLRLVPSADGSPRAEAVELTHRLGATTRSDCIPAGEFRLAAGPGAVRSTWWTAATPIAAGYVFAGKGFGHGAGLSQVGAWQMATDGHPAKAIVAHYYRGADWFDAY